MIPPYVDWKPLIEAINATGKTYQKIADDTGCTVAALQSYRRGKEIEPSYIKGAKLINLGFLTLPAERMIEFGVEVSVRGLSC